MSVLVDKDTRLIVQGITVAKERFTRRAVRSTANSSATILSSAA
jgi:succinyl-CoA synthetase alpha subunit